MKDFNLFVTVLKDFAVENDFFYTEDKMFHIITDLDLSINGNTVDNCKYHIAIRYDVNLDEVIWDTNITGERYYVNTPNSLTEQANEMLETTKRYR